ncbi:hypothetical protein MUG78_17550 [Gordonia alkaliphila]|uniref:hypothetical protein n=1 Tax=Gordonia alkaliphila TaxID=1053547 RepID=UPI001FF26E9D|nr:hypothetical protein [Gordonia alkaliphila]MCK0441207.1 hypothetical protein [Gordonia alkaliphila]
MSDHGLESLPEAENTSDDDDRSIVRIATHLRPKADALIARANRRLEKAGVEERFSLENLDTEVVGVVNESGVKVFIEVSTVRLSSPRIAAEGWEFVAKAEWDAPAQAVLMRTNPSAEHVDDLPIPEDLRCDHCGSVRTRRKAYLIRHTSGEIKVIGANCVAPFLGLSVLALWWLDGSHDLGTALGELGHERAPLLVDRDQVLALAWVLTNEGKDYKPSSFEESTRGQVANVLWPDAKEKPADKAWRVQTENAAAEVAAETIEALRAAATQLDPTSSYGHTLQAITASEWVSAKNLGYLVSLVSVYRRQIEQDAPARAKAEKAPTVTGPYAPEGTKIQGVAAVVTTRTSFTSDIEVRGSWIQQTRAVVVLRVIETGHLLKWISSSDAAFELGKHDEVVIERATVKELQVWRDEESTRIVRPKITITKAADE